MKNDNSILLSEASIATSKEVRQGTLLVEDGKIRSLVQFEYENFYYWIQIMEIESEEMQKIIEYIGL